MKTAWDLGKDVTYEILIANLGGYEKAKAECEARKRSGIVPAGLDRALLQHRREHGIYEVGDCVTYKAHFKGEWREGFGIITAIDNDLDAVDINENVGVAISEIDHATDEEIKANKRLEN